MKHPQIHIYIWCVWSFIIIGFTMPNFRFAKLAPKPCSRWPTPWWKWSTCLPIIVLRYPHSVIHLMYILYIVYYIYTYIWYVYTTIIQYIHISYTTKNQQQSHTKCYSYMICQFLSEMPTFSRPQIPASSSPSPLSGSFAALPPACAIHINQLSGWWQIQQWRSNQQKWWFNQEKNVCFNMFHLQK